MPARNFTSACSTRRRRQFRFHTFVDEFADERPAPRPIGTGLMGVVLRTGKRAARRPPVVVRRARRVGEVVLEGVDASLCRGGQAGSGVVGGAADVAGRACAMAVQDYGDRTGVRRGREQILTFVAEQLRFT